MAGQVDRINIRIGMSAYSILIGNSILFSIRDNRRILSADKVALVVSSRMFKFHEDYINKSFKGISGFDIIFMDDSEENKNYRHAEEFFKQFIEIGLNRRSVIVSIGGGVVGDFAGYLAAFYMRGIPVIHVPTTLLAMIDSSIGGKVGVNLSVGKNIVGAFHQPEMVICDIRFLTTLPGSEFKNGLVEIFKHGLIGEDETLKMLENNNFESISRSEIISRLIYLSASYKSSIVEKDEKEEGIRAILNYGHTAGHAIESLLRYRDLSHGEAVAIGIQVEVEISKRLGWLSDDEVCRINNIFDIYQLLNKEIYLKPEDIISHMKYDKKNSNGKINFVLLKGIQNPLINQQVDESLLLEVLEDVFIRRNLN